MFFIKLRFIKFRNFIKSKKVLKSSQSILWSYIFLFWCLFKPSRIISEINLNLFFKIVLYLYEILPLLSYLILIINTGIQLKISGNKFLDKKILLFLYFLNIFSLPIILRYSYLILFQLRNKNFLISVFLIYRFSKSLIKINSGYYMNKLKFLFDNEKIF